MVPAQPARDEPCSYLIHCAGSQPLVSGGLALASATCGVQMDLGEHPKFVVLKLACHLQKW